MIDWTFYPVAIDPAPIVNLPVGAGIIEGAIVSAILSAAIVATVQHFTAPDPQNRAGPPEASPATTHTRGSNIPLVVGRRTVGPVVEWVGEEIAEPQFQRVRRSAFRSAVHILTGHLYSEQAKHGLCVGPAQMLHGIRKNGEQILENPINLNTTSSGAVHECTDGSTFTIWRGGLDQVINERLVRHLSIRSAFKRECYIHWLDFKKGSVQQWPELTYDITGVAVGSLDADGYQGSNPAEIERMALTGTRPYGRQIDPDLIDETSLSAWGVQAATDRISANMLLGAGVTTGSVLESVARDGGIMHVQEGARLRFVPMRANSPAPITLDQDRVRGNPRRAPVLGDEPNVRKFWRFPDIDQRHQNNTVETRSGSVLSDQFSYSSTQPQLDLPTNAIAATLVASIRATYERDVDSEVKFTGLRDYSNLSPGQLIDFEQTPELGQCRITETSEDLHTGEIEITAVPGLMTNLVVGQAPFDVQAADVLLDPEPDPRMLLLDTSVETDPAPSILVLRIRANDQISDAALKIDPDSNGYIQIEPSMPHSIGGDLIESGSTPTGITWQPNTVFAGGDIVLPTDPTTRPGLMFTVVQGGTTGSTEPDWPASEGQALAGDGSINYLAESSGGAAIIRLAGPDRGFLDLSNDPLGYQGGEQHAVFSDGRIYLLRAAYAVGVSDRQSGAAVNVGDEYLPLGVNTGMVYEVTVAGITAVTEPSRATYEVNEGDTITDGTATLVARWPRYQLEGLSLTTLTYPVQSITPGVTTVFVVRSEIYNQIENVRITAGSEICVKTIPRVGNRTAIDSAVAETCLTLA